MTQVNLHCLIFFSIHFYNYKAKNYSFYAVDKKTPILYCFIEPTLLTLLKLDG